MYKLLGYEHLIFADEGRACADVDYEIRESVAFFSGILDDGVDRLPFGKRGWWPSDK